MTHVQDMSLVCNCTWLVVLLQGTHRVEYDDGDVQDEDLLHGDFRVLDGSQAQVRIAGAHVSKCEPPSALQALVCL